jgi:glycosyltransferase involved in cell wall biosynthesis
MRIAHFIQRYPPALGGSEAYFARLSRFLARQGDDVTVFTSSAIALEACWDRHALSVSLGVEVDEGITVRRYGLWRWPLRRYLLKALSFIPHRPWQCLMLPCNPVCPAMWSDCGRARVPFDVVHAAAFPYAWPIVCGLRLARRLRIPFLLTPFLHLGDADNPHDATRRGYLSPALQWLLRQADGVFAQTPSERDALLTLGIPPARVHLQGLGVDADECTGGDRVAVRRHWHAQRDTLVVGHLANNSREKGTTELLLAALCLWQRDVDLRIVLAGPEMPNFRTFWNRFAEQHPERAARAVVRLGPLSDQQKRDFFAGIDVFALPSRSDSFGLVLLEAWANGVPNVAYRAGGIADVIQPGRDGLLVPCGDIAGLAAGLERLHANPEMRHRMGAAGQQRLNSEFRWDEKLGQVATVYRALAKSPIAV